MLKRSLAVIAALGGVVACIIVYNGHAGLGASIQDGTSNTVMFGAASVRPGPSLPPRLPARHPEAGPSGRR